MSESTSKTITAAAASKPATRTRREREDAAPADHLLAGLESSVAVVTGLDFDALEATIVGDTATYFAAALPRPPRAIPEDRCDDPEPEVAPFCHQLKLDNMSAQRSYTTTTASAVGALKAELANWTMALANYEFAVANAEVTMQASIAAATKIYEPKLNHDSPSRLINLYFELKEAVAAAAQTYLVTRASAGGALAGEAGTLLGAYATFVGAMEQAQNQLVSAQATADQTFWQSVESVRVAA